MSVTATPTITVAGLTVALTPAGPGSLVGIDALHITWGRSGTFDQPSPATAQVTVLDRSTDRGFVRAALVGQLVTLGWSCSDGTSGTNFRGRITDAAAHPLHGGDVTRGWVVTLSCSSLEVDLANYYGGPGTVLPTETFTARVSRLLAGLPAGVLAGRVVLPEWSDIALSVDPGNAPSSLGAQMVAQVDASGTSVRDQLAAIFRSLSPLPMVYDPGADRFTFAPRLRYRYTQAGLTMSAQLLPSSDHGGRYVPAALSGLHLDARRTGYSAALLSAIGTRITWVEAQFLDANLAWASSTQYTDTVWTSGAAATGHRKLSVSTQHASGAATLTLAKLYADVANREAALPRLASPLSVDTAREPLHNGTHARLLLSAHERGVSVFVGHSWLPGAGASPLLGVIGGVVAYSGGQWQLALTTQPVNLDPGAGHSWAPLPISAAATAGVRLADLDPSLTFGDMAFVDVGAGSTTLTALPYKGNQ